ncbi:hypothetical protein [Ferruginivarius sediminum]|uniref:Uncharacterized protein n=1 Tax=Ferruginivarius sediminum TaxID=2661937 RepID=A0A369T7Q9_9PROT|nr:hypothetical protein [Ferruginivarius sediminum]RDD60494.1 hypothetical protein DRB17_18010 [Ferruginivarius sediminum]
MSTMRDLMTEYCRLGSMSNAESQAGNETRSIALGRAQSGVAEAIAVTPATSLDELTWKLRWVLDSFAAEVPQVPHYQLDARDRMLLSAREELDRFLRPNTETTA